MVLLVCVPLVAVGLWTFLFGGGGASLLASLACMAMMLVMHGVMGAAHRH